ncbi:uncharacterized protein MELLADRAFT_96150 [Melampsora larici-populina 98AG31]|uniref:Uncharacterized protein n=1 Tax=Melampsora larici-populina (strain 98AG31 / pathotype 3-4-7) TaxID=747676 RepID=F4SB56_MELLP|nr:uncharacterized protein MELLADRAFT_96150 [Melampsora larici-populina 98AG31]EGF98120.1 hypothetical protein MELLADRAFT_96150 [Melampsora larici-populina 98AG31]
MLTSELQRLKQVPEQYHLMGPIKSIPRTFFNLFPLNDLNPSIGFSTSLASTSNGAVTKMTNISEVAQCPNFWAMPVHALYEWRRHVNILDRTLLGYYEQALDEAEKDLDRAASEPDVLDTSIVTPSGRPSAPRSGRKRSVKDETAAPGGSGPAFKFLKARPDRLDLLFMRALEALSPFGSNGQKVKISLLCSSHPY